MKAKYVTEVTNALNPELDISVYEESIQIKVPKDFNGEIFRHRHDVEIDFRMAIPDLSDALARFYARFKEEMGADEPTAGEDENIPDQEPPASGPNHGLTPTEERFAYNVGDSTSDLPTDAPAVPASGEDIRALKFKDKGTIRKMAAERGLDKLDVAARLKEQRVVLTSETFGLLYTWYQCGNFRKPFSAFLDIARAYGLYKKGELFPEVDSDVDFFILMSITHDFAYTRVEKFLKSDPTQAFADKIKIA